MDADVEESGCGLEPQSRSRAYTWHGPPKDPHMIISSSEDREFPVLQDLLAENHVDAFRLDNMRTLDNIQEFGESGLNTIHSGDSAPRPDQTRQVGAGESTANQKRPATRRNAWGSQSYADLIALAIESAPERRLTLAQIYDWVIHNVPYFSDKGESSSSAGWKNSIRHNLSLHRRFARVHNESSGKSSWWVVCGDNGPVGPPGQPPPGRAPRRRATMSSSADDAFDKKRTRARGKINDRVANCSGGVGGVTGISGVVPSTLPRDERPLEGFVTFQTLLAPHTLPSFKFVQMECDNDNRRRVGSIERSDVIESRVSFSAWDPSGFVVSGDGGGFTIEGCFAGNRGGFDAVEAVRDGGIVGLEATRNIASPVAVKMEDISYDFNCVGDASAGGRSGTNLSPGSAQTQLTTLRNLSESYMEDSSLPGFLFPESTSSVPFIPPPPYRSLFGFVKSEPPGGTESPAATQLDYQVGQDFCERYPEAGDDEYSSSMQGFCADPTGRLLLAGYGPSEDDESDELRQCYETPGRFEDPNDRSTGAENESSALACRQVSELTIYRSDEGQEVERSGTKQEVLDPMEGLSNDSFVDSCGIGGGAGYHLHAKSESAGRTMLSQGGADFDSTRPDSLDFDYAIGQSLGMGNQGGQRLDVGSGEFCELDALVKEEAFPVEGSGGVDLQGGGGDGELPGGEGGGEEQWELSLELTLSGCGNVSS